VILDGVAVLVNDTREFSCYEVAFENPDLASGVYLYGMQASSFVQTRKLILLR
jgi:hypothetical protein